MKKSIIYLGIAFISFTTVSQATNLKSIQRIETNKPEYANTTLLNVAIYKGELDFIKKLVEYGADVNQESHGLTPLMIAARYNNVEVIKFLLSKGAKLNYKNKLGLNAAKYAQISNANAALGYLKTRKSSALASL